jgi:hypothetical protein
MSSTCGISGEQCDLSFAYKNLYNRMGNFMLVQFIDFFLMTTENQYTCHVFTDLVIVAGTLIFFFLLVSCSANGHFNVYLSSGVTEV